jgi:hypothetical protein
MQMLRESIELKKELQLLKKQHFKGGTSFTNRTVSQTRWVDPLAQSFEVPDENGVFITKCDVFFKSKDTNSLPITMQIRTMQTGLPTQTIIPFGEVVLDPSQVNLSDELVKLQLHLLSHLQFILRQEILIV